MGPWRCEVVKDSLNQTNSKFRKSLACVLLRPKGFPSISVHRLPLAKQPLVETWRKVCAYKKLSQVGKVLLVLPHSAFSKTSSHIPKTS
jgi:hypothetical protein